MMVVMAVGAVGIISFSEKRFLSVTEVKFLGLGFRLVGGDILDLGGGFVTVVVEMEVDNLESGVRAVVRLVWNCLDGRLYFLWCLNQKSLEGKMSSDGGRLFGIVMRADFLKEFFFFDGFCLGKVTVSKKDVVWSGWLWGWLRGWFELVWGCCWDVLG